jgi:thiol-disulfide isomerase/thioredoxin
MSNGPAPEFRGKIRSPRRRKVPPLRRKSFFTKNVSFHLAICASPLVFHLFVSSARADVAPSLSLATLSCPPPFALHDLDGRERTLGKSGRPILVHFFATWCEPCRAELATLQKFFARRSDDVAVFAIDVGEVAARVRRFVDTAPVSFPILLDEDRAVTKAWRVDSLPTTIVLDSALNPRLAVTDDLDWGRPDVGAEIDRLARAPSAPQADCQREDR